ncbi:MAG: hypothetical protein M1504_00985 [Candidatus Marsarchaeota archaeon]|nr:hypothetical protein [Candidatus Marsarchaeota archaeon]
MFWLIPIVLAAIPTLADFTPIVVIFILIIAAAGLSRGMDIFQFLGIGTLLGITSAGAGGAGKGLKGGKIQKAMAGTMKKNSAFATALGGLTKKGIKAGAGAAAKKISSKLAARKGGTMGQAIAIAQSRGYAPTKEGLRQMAKDESEGKLRPIGRAAAGGAVAGSFFGRVRTAASESRRVGRATKVGEKDETAKQKAKIADESAQRYLSARKTVEDAYKSGGKPTIGQKFALNYQQWRHFRGLNEDGTLKNGKWEQAPIIRLPILPIGGILTVVSGGHLTRGAAAQSVKAMNKSDSALYAYAKSVVTDAKRTGTLSLPPPPIPSRSNPTIVQPVYGMASTSGGFGMAGIAVSSSGQATTSFGGQYTTSSGGQYTTSSGIGQVTTAVYATNSSNMPTRAPELKTEVQKPYVPFPEQITNVKKAWKGTGMGDLAGDVYMFGSLAARGLQSMESGIAKVGVAASNAPYVVAAYAGRAKDRVTGAGAEEDRGKDATNTPTRAPEVKEEQEKTGFFTGRFVPNFMKEPPQWLKDTYAYREQHGTTKDVRARTEADNREKNVANVEREPIWKEEWNERYGAHISESSDERHQRLKDTYIVKQQVDKYSENLQDQNSGPKRQPSSSGANTAQQQNSDVSGGAKKPPRKVKTGRKRPGSDAEEEEEV